MPVMPHHWNPRVVMACLDEEGAMGFWSRVFGTRVTPSTATNPLQGDALGDVDARRISCPSCGQPNAIPRVTPPWGTAMICSQCKASLIRVSDPHQRPYTSPREVGLFLGYQGCSLIHARCPWCREVNYAVVVPEKGYSTSFYWNRKQANPSAALVVNTRCPYCERPYVIEWDDDPR